MAPRSSRDRELHANTSERRFTDTQLRMVPDRGSHSWNRETGREILRQPHGILLPQPHGISLPTTYNLRTIRRTSTWNIHEREGEVEWSALGERSASGNGATGLPRIAGIVGYVVLSLERAIGTPAERVPVGIVVCNGYPRRRALSATERKPVASSHLSEDPSPNILLPLLPLPGYWCISR